MVIDEEVVIVDIALKRLRSGVLKSMLEDHVRRACGQADSLAVFVPVPVPRHEDLGKLHALSGLANRPFPRICNLIREVVIVFTVVPFSRFAQRAYSNLEKGLARLRFVVSGSGVARP